MDHDLNLSLIARIYLVVPFHDQNPYHVISALHDDLHSVVAGWFVLGHVGHQWTQWWLGDFESFVCLTQCDGWCLLWYPFQSTWRLIPSQNEVNQELIHYQNNLSALNLVLTQSNDVPVPIVWVCWVMVHQVGIHWQFRHRIDCRLFPARILLESFDLLSAFGLNRGLSKCFNRFGQNLTLMALQSIGWIHLEFQWLGETTAMHFQSFCLCL